MQEPRMSVDWDFVNLIRDHDGYAVITALPQLASNLPSKVHHKQNGCVLYTGIVITPRVQLHLL